MPNIFQTVLIVHVDGLPLLSVDLDLEVRDGFEGLVSLFGGVSSAINTLMQELGHTEIKSITVSDGVLVYSSQDPVLFVVHAIDEKYEHLAEIFINQIKREFLATYNDVLDDPDAIATTDTFVPFVDRVHEIFDSLIKLNAEYPELIRNLPSIIPLPELYEVLHLGLDIIKGYPDDTIKIVRKLDQYFGKEGLLETVSQTLGRYSGQMIAKSRLKDSYVVRPDDVLKLLDEISVVKLDMKDERFEMKLCPVCRGKTADHPICDFFSGFIEGALNNPAIHVQEISCRAMGDESCQFQLSRE